MTKIAIDIVLLPPEEVMDLCIEINHLENEKGNGKGKLADDDFYPHISLAMGCIRKEQLVEVSKIVEKVGQQFGALTLQLGRPYHALKEDQTKSYALKVSGKGLRKMHNRLMEELSGFLTYDSTSKEIYLREEEPEFVNRYKEKFSFNNFSPHLTLRVKELTSNIPKIIFKANRLAICHLGISTTCRKILFETKLTSSNI